MNFSPSASGCSSPNGPTRCGPQRFCMWPTSLRSSQVVYATAVSSTTSAITILITVTTTKVVMVSKSFHSERSC